MLDRFYADLCGFEAAREIFEFNIYDKEHPDEVLATYDIMDGKVHKDHLLDHGYDKIGFAQTKLADDMGYYELCERTFLHDYARKLWEELEDVPIDENENIDIDWHQFPEGTFREDIWHWFEDELDMPICILMGQEVDAMDDDELKEWLKEVTKYTDFDYQISAELVEFVWAGDYDKVFSAARGSRYVRSIEKQVLHWYDEFDYNQEAYKNCKSDGYSDTGLPLACILDEMKAIHHNLYRLHDNMLSVQRRGQVPALKSWQVEIKVNGEETDLMNLSHEEQYHLISAIDAGLMEGVL